MFTRPKNIITRLLAAAVLLLCLGFFSTPGSARASALNYGLIGENATLYDKSGADYVSKVNLPSNYFAVLLGEENADGYIPVTYLDITGFLKPDSVSPVDYEPKYKYASENSLKLTNDGHGVTVRSTPDHTQNNVITSLNEGEELYYYGEVKGSAQIEQLGDTWYFVRFTLNGELSRGYIYSLYADAQPVKANVIEKVEPPAPAQQENPTEPGYTPISTEPEDPDTEPTVDPKFTLTKTSEIIIVVSLCIPVVIIMYLLFKKPPKKDE